MAKEVVLISHAGAQKDLAIALDKRLSDDGFRPIIYERDFPKDTDFVEEIADSVVDSDAVLALASEAYVISNWCVKEYIMAQVGGRLVPVIVEDCDASNLPYVEDAIDVRGMSEADAVSFIATRFKEFKGNLDVKPIDSKEAFDFVEQTLIPLPIFGGERSEQWQRHAHEYIEALFQDENIHVDAIPEIVETREQAEAILKANNADIVLYGKRVGKYIEMGFVTSRGWNLTKGRDEITIPKDLKFKIIGEDFGELTIVLKLAFGNLEAARNRHDRAITHYSEALGVGVAPERARHIGLQYIYGFRAEERLSQDMLTEALSDYFAAIDLDDTESMFFNNRAYIFGLLGKYDESIKDFDIAIMLDPDNPTYFHNRGAAYIQLSKFEEAERDLKKAVELDKAYAKAFHQLGSLFYNTGRLNEALECLNRSIELDDKYYTVYRYRALVQKGLGLYAAALEDYDRMLALFPRYPEQSPRIYQDIGDCFYHVGNYKAANVFFSKIIALEPNYSLAYIGRAYTNKMLGKLCDALVDFRQYVTLSNSTDSQIRQEITELEAIC